MVAYNFHRRFVPLIQQGLKRQTIRKYGLKRHARPGERMQLYTGMRTLYCEKVIEDPLCSAVSPISISVRGGMFLSVRLNHVAVLHLDRFAIDDGFVDAGDMMKFWLETHGTAPFEGVLIEWSPVAESLERVAA